MPSIRSRWPTEILLPVMVAILEASTIAPLLHLVFSPQGSLYHGHPVPWPWMFAVIILAAFWTTRVLNARVSPLRSARAASLVMWLLVTLLWIAKEYMFSDTTGDRWENPSSSAHLLVPFTLAFLAWWHGVALGADPEPFTPEALHRDGRLAWTVLIGTVLIAAVVSGAGSKDALNSARLAIPTAVVAGLLAVTIAQIEQARRTALKHAGGTPERRGWLLFAGVSSVVVVATGIGISGLLSRNIWDLFYQPVQTGTTWVLYGVEYAIFAFALAIFLAAFPVLWLARHALGSHSPSGSTSSATTTPAEFAKHADEVRRQLPTGFTETLRWLLLAMVMVTVVLLVASALRRYQPTQVGVMIEEHRESMWSRDLFLKQFKHALLRGPVHAAPVPIDLADTPSSVREAYRYLGALAEQYGIGRDPAESASVFSARLCHCWPDVTDTIGDLTERYEQVRYGDTPDRVHLAAARSDWNVVHQRHTPHSEHAPKTARRQAQPGREYQ